MKFIFFIIIIVIFFPVFSFSQTGENEIKNNYEIFNTLTDKSFEKIENDFYVLDKEKVFCVKFDRENERSKFLLYKLRNKFHDFKIVSANAIKNSDYLINMSGLNLVTKYGKYSGSYSVNKKYQRNLNIEYYYTLSLIKNDSVINKYEAKEKYSDSFNIERRDEIERSNFEFTKAELPEQSLIQKLFLPGIIIAASAITIVLFFTTRSK